AQTRRPRQAGTVEETGVGKADGPATAQDPRGLPHLPPAHPRRTSHSHHPEKTTGERYALKGARTVREGADGKGPEPREPRRRPTSLMYQSRTGCQWSLLPHDLPPRSAVMYYYTAWRKDGTDKTIHDLLRFQVREKNRRLADPSLVVLDTQSVRAAAGVPKTTTGRDAAKKVPGRKRGLATDVLGLVIAVVVAAASIHD